MMKIYEVINTEIRKESPDETSCREIDYKVNQTWNDNGTITFQNKKRWFFEKSLSNGSLSDKVTNLNPIAVVRHDDVIARKLPVTYFCAFLDRCAFC